VRKLTLFATLVFGALAAPAATVTITNFTASPGDDSANFTTDVINSTFDSTSVRITNSSISCGSFHDGACGSIAADFEITGNNLTTTTPLNIHIDGSVTFIPPITSIGTTSAEDSTTVIGDLKYWVTSAPSLQTSIPFSVTGDFDKDLANTFAPPENINGDFDISGTLSLTLEPGQTITLPSSLAFTLTPASVPEPSSALLLAGGLGLAWLGRRRLARRA